MCCLHSRHSNGCKWGSAKLCALTTICAICALYHVRRACCAIGLAGVPSVAAHSNNSALTMINRAVACFWDLPTDLCVLNGAPLSWQCSVAAAHPFIVWNNS